MALTLSNIQEVGFGVESSHLAGPAAYTYLPVKGLLDTSGLKQTAHEDDRSKQGLYQLAPHAGEKSDSTLSVQLEVPSWSAATPTEQPTVNTVYADVLAQAIGLSFLSGPSSFVSMADNEKINGTKMIITPTATTDFIAGQCIGLYTCSTDENLTPMYEVARVKQVTATTLVLDQPLAQGYGYATNLKIHTGIDIVPVATCTSGDESAAIRIRRQGTSEWETFGLRASSAKLDMTPKGIIQATLEYMVGNWTYGVDTAAAYNALPVDEDSTTLPRLQALAGKIRAYDGSTAVDLDGNSLEFDPGISWIRNNGLPLISSAQGVQDGCFGPYTPVLSVNPTWGSLRDYFSAQTALSVIAQAGSAPGSTIAVCLPNAYLKEEAAHGDRDGIESESDMLMATHYAGDLAADDGAIAEDDVGPECKDFVITLI